MLMLGITIMAWPDLPPGLRRWYIFFTFLELLAEISLAFCLGFLGYFLWLRISGGL